MTRVNETVNAFVTAIAAAWPAVSGLSTELAPQSREGFLSDWLQSMWEMLVEAAVSQNGQVFLEVYGDGADCNPRSSRVFQPDALPTGAIHCVAVAGSVLDVLTQTTVDLPDQGCPLDRFVTLDGSGWYTEAPPFDHVLLGSLETEIVVSAADLDFILTEKNHA
jgi:hypothetical protein